MTKVVSWLDIKLGWRMLARYPGLTIVGGLAMAVAVAIGAGFFGVIYSMMDSTLPFDEGDRIVSIQQWDAASEDRPERRVLHDFMEWRNQAKSVADLGAFIMRTRNVATPLGGIEPLAVAEMTAAGFRVARTRPILGRPLLEADERPGALPVVVIGHDIWQERFGGDPAILQKTLQLAGTPHQIVGVMPEGFGWPLWHSLWIPFRADTAGFARREGPVIYVFGRLAPGRSLEDAASEFTAIGKRAAAAYPATHAQLEPTVLPYTFPFFDVDDTSTAWVYHLLQLLVTMLLVLICVNIATLVYARTATRRAEIAVRSALGASRRRIVSQLFAEGLVLAGLASLAGLLTAKWALSQVGKFVAAALGNLPFWMDFDLSLGVVLYVVGVTLLAAMIVGALPAFKATGQRVHPQLRELSGTTGLKLGRTWTILIVAQVAFAVAILPSTILYTLQFTQFGMRGPGFDAGRFLSASLSMEMPTHKSGEPDSVLHEFRARAAASQTELMKRIRAEPDVASGTFALSEPSSESTAMIQVEGVPAPADSVNYSLGEGTRHGHGARVNRVDAEYFANFDAAINAGRAFTAADRDSAASVAIVNQTFMNGIMRGQDPVGRRFRYVGRGGDTSAEDIQLGRWFEIVGVVEDFPPREMDLNTPRARIYHPAVMKMHPTIIVRMARGTPASFVPRLKEIANQVDPTLQLRSITSLEDAMRTEQRMFRLGAIATLLMTASVLLLSAAGIYSMMSLTVHQRRREIGIRSALGAQPRRIVRQTFLRAARQLGIGVGLGIIAALVLDQLMWGEILLGHGEYLLPGVSALMVAIGLAAAIGPVRRGLRIQPTEALREQ